MSAAILSTIAPNKLADVTDVITGGIRPRVENIERISEEIQKHSTVPNTVTENMGQEEVMRVFSTLSDDEKLEFFSDFKLEEGVKDNTNTWNVACFIIKNVDVMIDGEEVAGLPVVGEHLPATGFDGVEVGLLRQQYHGFAEHGV